ncbi:hypothetical protein QZH41_009293 [Actinostola sp. cb2023]|nr:hypothetical protein QZH41_009293 [Actinostola sp. cb2023]
MDESLDVSEIEANPQQYNPLQPVNYYGSPIALPGTSEDTNDEVFTRPVNFYGLPIASDSTNPGPRTVEDTNNEVELISTLTVEKKDSLLIRLLSQGRGSVEFAKNILQDVEDPDPDEPSGSEIVP